MITRGSAIGRQRPAAWLTALCLLLILAVALALRLYGINWDQGYLFHPDERQILMVTSKLQFPWPPDWSVLLSPKSPWNPSFFAYGSLPLYLLRICSWVAARYNHDLGTLESMHLVGRFLSALFDVGSVAVVYALGRRLHGRAVGLLGAALLAFTVLHIQMSHFYTVDTLLTFFVLLTLLAAVRLYQRRTVGRGVVVGLAFGMALATKVSAAPLVVPVALAWFLGPEPGEAAPGVGASRGRRLLKKWLGLLITGLVSLATFAVCEPYAILDVVAFAVDVATEGQLARGSDVPYTRQFIGTLPYLYPAWQAMLWSLGLPLGLAGFGAWLAQIIGAVVAAVRKRAEHWHVRLIPLSWALIYFGLVGSFHTKFLRYLLPILPLLCLWAAWALLGLMRSAARPRRLWRALGWVALALVVLGSTLYALAYTNVYRETHPWIQATAWLCSHLPKRTAIANEHWDDPLPLLQGLGDLRCYRQMTTTQLPVYNRDDTAKLDELLSAIERSEYIILSSNRLYDTIARLPGRYPLTSRYYQLLLGEKLGYQLVYYAATYPKLFGIELVDDTFGDPPLPVPALLAQARSERRQLLLGRADESYSVYDHPMALVFHKTEQLSREQLLALFGDAALGLPEPPAD